VNRLLMLMLSIVAIVVPISPVMGQQYPSKPIHLIIPFPPGLFSDVLGRLFADQLSKQMGQAVVVENRAGASGNIGASAVAKAAPDGYTLLLNSLNYVINPAVMPMPFDSFKDLVPVAMIAEGAPAVLAVPTSSKYKTLQDLIDDAKAHPDEVSFYTPGPGSSTHLLADLFAREAKIKVLLVPFKDGGLAALIGGQVSAGFTYTPSYLPQAEGGKLRGLVVASARRSPVAPSIPTTAELGFSTVDGNSFIGLMAPANTPTAVIERLNAAIAAILKDKGFVDRLAGMGMTPAQTTPEQFGRYMEQQVSKWAEVARATAEAK